MVSYFVFGWVVVDLFNSQKSDEEKENSGRYASWTIQPCRLSAMGGFFAAVWGPLRLEC